MLEAEELPVQHEAFFRCEEVVEVRLFGKKSEAFVSLSVPQGASEQRPITLVGEHDAEKDFDGRCLAGTIRTKQAEDVASRDIQGQVLDGHLPFHSQAGSV